MPENAIMFSSVQKGEKKDVVYNNNCSSRLFAISILPAQ